MHIFYGSHDVVPLNWIQRELVFFFSVRTTGVRYLDHRPSTTARNRSSEATLVRRSVREVRHHLATLIRIDLLKKKKKRSGKYVRIRNKYFSTLPKPCTPPNCDTLWIITMKHYSRNKWTTQSDTKGGNASINQRLEFRWKGHISCFAQYFLRMWTCVASRMIKTTARTEMQRFSMRFFLDKVLILANNERKLYISSTYGNVVILDQHFAVFEFRDWWLLNNDVLVGGKPVWVLLQNPSAVDL